MDKPCSEPFLSIVIPVWNDFSAVSLLLQDLIDLDALILEIILVDGGKDERLEDLASAFTKVTLTRTLPQRAGQMNWGAEQASGRVLWFLHADTRLTSDVSSDLITFVQQASRSWGRFDVRLDQASGLLKVVEWMMNRRSALTGIATGDQGMFVYRDVFEQVGRFPSQALMEDIELSKRLKLVSKPYLPKSKLVTSSRKWLREGVLRTVVKMWYLRFIYWRGASAQEVHDIYYRQK